MGKPIIHFEIGCRNKEKTTAFYRDLLNWKTESYGPATMIDTDAMGMGIGGHISSMGHEPGNYTVVYAQVEDLKTYIDKATKLGGKQIVPPTEVPGMGHFAWIADPEGTPFGLWKPIGE